MTLLAGVDVGTSSIKAVIIDRTGAVRSSGRTPMPWRDTADGLQASAEDIAAGTNAALAAALNGVTGQVVALGVTGLAESGVLTDRAGRACSAVLPWHDLRGQEELSQLASAVPQLGELTGQFLTTRLTAVKYRWMRNRLPTVAAPGWRSVPEEVLAQLGGRPVPELSQWSRTGFADISSGAYCEAVADWAGLPWRDMPAPVVAGTPLGSVRTDHPLAAIRGATLTTAGQDHVCAALGAGVTGARRVFDSWGNGEALVRGHDGPADGSGVRSDVTRALAAGCSISWGLGAGERVLFRGLGTGLVLHRVLGMLGSGAGNRDQLDSALARLNPDLELPRLTAAEDGTISVTGGPADATAAMIWAAALDWAFERVNTGLAALEALSGPIEGVVGCGGWLRSPPILARKAARVRAFTPYPAAEPAAIGAALISSRTLAAC